MKKILMIMFIPTVFALAETLFEVKDASNNKVLDVSTDGLAVMNQGDTIMVISTTEIKAVIDDSKALSRKFSVSTTSAKKGLYTDLFDVSMGSSTMRESGGNRYTDFSPENIFLGLNSGINTIPTNETSGENNVFIGNNSGQSNSSGASNVFLGYKSGFSNGTGYKNCFIGQEAGYANTDGFYNVFVGYFSGNESARTFNNTFVGHEAGKKTVLANEYDGCYNAFFGSGSGATNTTGTYNSFFGAFSGTMNTTGSRNAFFGRNAGFQMTTGSENTGMGQNSSRFLKSGNYNTSLGVESGYSNEAGSRNVFLGYRAGYSEIGSDKLYIDNSNTSTPLIYGEFDNDLVMINGKLGVGVSPIYRIHSVDSNTSGDDPAVFGKHAVTDYYGVGVKGEGGYKGVVGYASANTGEIHGVEGIASGTGGTKVGVYGEASGGSTNWAGYFAGDINVTGTVTKSKDEIKIDHPQDPANRILSHTGVNSDEMINVYNGNIILNGDGKAVIELPVWFESFNTDFRYQLTPLGAPANLYISKEISNNSFEISGGSSNMKVSWQVTGVRKDNYAKFNPIKIETEKNSDDKGFYLHPEAFGLSSEKSVDQKNKKERK